MLFGAVQKPFSLAMRTVEVQCSVCSSLLWYFLIPKKIGGKMELGL
jgi:hypothetical protein